MNGRIEALTAIEKSVVVYLGEHEGATLRDVHWGVKGASIVDFERALKRLVGAGLVKREVTIKSAAKYWNAPGTVPHRAARYSLI